MKKQKIPQVTPRYERACGSSHENKYVLRLYVAGATPASLRAIENVKALCDRHLKGRYQLEVIDVYQRPELARGVQIVAVPTLVKVMPAPLRRFIGAMSIVGHSLLGLGAGT